MNLVEPFLFLSLLAVLQPPIAVLIRGRSNRILVMATMLVSVSVVATILLLLQVVDMGPRPRPNAWVYALVSSSLPVLLTSYIFSLTFGRENPDRCLRSSRRTLALMALAGGAFLLMLRHPEFVTGYDWAGGRGTIRLGYVGKAYLTYLLLGHLIIGYNLEKTYRVSSTEDRFRLRLPLLGVFALLGYLTFLLATGILYSAVGLGKLVALGFPCILASLLVAHGYLRGFILDLAAPVSRNVVYSSFTALFAGVFVVAIGIAGQLATVTRWSPDEILIVAAAFLVALVTLLLLCSNRFHRSLRRYIDRNFYVNRYDYRSQWSNLTGSLRTAKDADHLLALVQPLLLEVFVADDITIALRHPITSRITVTRGKGADSPSPETLEEDSPLHCQLASEGKSLLLDRKPHDFMYIPIYAENDSWLEHTASQIIAPLMDGGLLIGSIGLERIAQDDRFTFEDAALLDSIAGHVASTLRCLQLAGELAESREMELLSQWSSMILHDLKNYMAPLRLAASNLMEYRTEPQLVARCAEDVVRVTDRMDELVHMLSDLRGGPTMNLQPICPNDLVEETIGALQVGRKAELSIHKQLTARQRVTGDRSMLKRVLENLVTNAIEAMHGSGDLTVRTEDRNSNGSSRVCISVADTGKGMTQDFVRESLFRPFSTTKPQGLGLGLYQSLSIVKGHGGELNVSSVQGIGSQFQLLLRATEPTVAHVESREPLATPEG